jgi:hypothetical protein
MFGFWIAYDDVGNVIGYTASLLNTIPGLQRLHILRFYAKDKFIEQQFETILKEWAKPYKIRTAQVSVIKGVKALQRKFKFVPVSVNMEKRF